MSSDTQDDGTVSYRCVVIHKVMEMVAQIMELSGGGLKLSSLKMEGSSV